MPISDQDHAYQLKKTEERYENDLTALRNECDRRLAALREATTVIADMKRENDRLQAQLKRSGVGVITNRVIDAASSLLSDVRWPNKVAEHIMAGRIAKPPLEKMRSLYATELHEERLAGARALVATLPYVDDPDDGRPRAVQQGG